MGTDRGAQADGDHPLGLPDGGAHAPALLPAPHSGQSPHGAGTNKEQRGWMRVNLGATELWYVVNLSPDTHPIQVHLVDFAVQRRFGFERDGGTGVFDPSAVTLARITATDAWPIGPEMQGPKDTVRANPGEMVGIAMTFAPFPSHYVYHCHILEHEDHGMMRPFVVVPPWVPHHEHEPKAGLSDRARRSFRPGQPVVHPAGGEPA
ncbi:multicopper oxidase domain-containing protein [Paracraurococcus sp. LOR1-02]|uniref:Multicopper oxidase domain-containing protein n=1 Tax=Paracraurococcus lichenis TaxID=3064888 RepID=A0ABT9EC00_9PROT|nr:multicopper oxidase domain-containing protein [Paracraurococcus sp. LOR1-02]MDO9713736.1 multicopper oxidase domain-containing protein [Paracraurococcus sp. LOR1-02]